MSLNVAIAGIAWAVAASCIAVQSRAEPGDRPANAPHVASPGADSSKSESAVPALTVSRALLAANGSMLQVHFTVPPPKSTQWLPVDQKDTYVVDEATGEKFFVLNLVRIGPAAQTRLPRGGGSSYMVIDNRYEHLKPGARITVVIGALKQEHVKVAEQ
jgi:hypothetical protein